MKYKEDIQKILIDSFELKLIKYSNEINLNLVDISLIVSLSGGVDSMVLASMSVQLRNKYGFKIAFVHFNHHAHLMSRKIQDFTTKYSKENRVDFYLQHIYLNSSNNFESRARKERYHMLNSIAMSYSFDMILTGHTKDDQVETIYMKEIDGGDWMSKIGIYEEFGKLRRPLLDIDKKQIQDYAINNQISWKWR